eukprot:10671503-Alexandrium_andersonii.AAC.1
MPCEPRAVRNAGHVNSRGRDVGCEGRRATKKYTSDCNRFWVRAITTSNARTPQQSRMMRQTQMHTVVHLPGVHAQLHRHDQNSTACPWGIGGIPLGA